MSDDLISREKLLEQTAEWEAAALDHVGKLDPKERPEVWIRWSTILQERTAFKHDVQDAQAEHPELHEWCTDCKEYDREKHCCPRYNRVILEALTEMEKQITGKWERHYSRPGVYADLCWHCSACGYKTDYSWAHKFKFCPECGTRMEENSAE